MQWSKWFDLIVHMWLLKWPIISIVNLRLTSCYDERIVCESWWWWWRLLLIVIISGTWPAGQRHLISIACRNGFTFTCVISLLVLFHIFSSTCKDKEKEKKSGEGGLLSSHLFNDDGSSPPLPVLFFVPISFRFTLNITFNSPSRSLSTMLDWQTRLAY